MTAVHMGRVKRGSKLHTRTHLPTQDKIDVQIDIAEETAERARVGLAVAYAARDLLGNHGGQWDALDRALTLYAEGMVSEKIKLTAAYLIGMLEEAGHPNHLNELDESFPVDAFIYVREHHVRIVSNIDDSEPNMIDADVLDIERNSSRFRRGRFYIAPVELTDDQALAYNQLRSEGLNQAEAYAAATMD